MSAAEALPVIAPLTITDNDPMPVELLRDGRGIYGIGVSESFDFEAVAWRCGIMPEPYTFQRAPNALILRPDWFMETKPHKAVLQKIVGGFRRGPFMHSGEEQLRQFIHHEALKRSGLPWPPPDNHHARWWATNKEQQTRNRGIYHCLRCLSLHVINDLISADARKARDLYHRNTQEACDNGMPGLASHSIAPKIWRFEYEKAEQRYRMNREHGATR